MKKGICGFGILVGVLAVILAIVCFCKSTGYTESSHSYGGDAYTGIQNASAQAANNTYYLSDIVKFAGGSILLVSGLLSVAYFGMKIFEGDNDCVKTDSNNTSYPSFVSDIHYAFSRNSVDKSETSEIDDTQSVQAEMQSSEVKEWKCPDCGKINQGFMENCFDCGAKKP